MSNPGKITLDQIGSYLDDLRAITYAQMRATGDLGKSATTTPSAVLQGVIEDAAKKGRSWEHSGHLRWDFRRAIRQKLIDKARARTATKRPQIDGDKCIEDLEIAADSGDSMELPEGFEQALHELQKEQPDWAAAIRARFWDEDKPTWEHVARALNLTQDQARYRVTKALEFLKKKIGQKK